MHCELQHELTFMQSGAAGDLHTGGNLELKLINTRDVLTAGSEETFKLREVQEYRSPLCIWGKCTWDR